MTGKFMDEFIPTGSGGLGRPGGLLFGPNGKKDGGLDLYVASSGNNSILRYDGTSGTFRGAFVSSASGWLDHETSLAFGPDGNLYVANWAAGKGHQAVLRFQGPSAVSPGAPLPSAGNSGADFIAPGSGGMLAPVGVVFGPDGNGDCHFDLYVTNAEYHGGNALAKENTGTVKRFDGVTGTFIDTFVTVGSGGLREPFFLTFTQTDPVTLAYTGEIVPSAAESTAAAIADTYIADIAQSEDNHREMTLFTFTVTLSAAYDEPATLWRRTVKASNGDYSAKTDTLSFAPGETTKTITIEIKGDSKTEANETFTLDLFGNSSNALFTKNRGIGTILNDD